MRKRKYTILLKSYNIYERYNISTYIFFIVIYIFFIVIYIFFIVIYILATSSKTLRICSNFVKPVRELVMEQWFFILQRGYYNYFRNCDCRVSLYFGVGWVMRYGCWTSLSIILLVTSFIFRLYWCRKLDCVKKTTDLAGK